MPDQQQRLNQVLTVEAGLKSRIEEERTGIYHTLQKTSAFDGLARHYKPLHEGGERRPSESKRVQFKAEDLLNDAVAKMVTLWNITATKDYANCNAKGSIVVDGHTIVQDVPVTCLLFLEKELIHVRTLISKLPVLDAAESWQQDANSGLWKSEKVEKQSTAKVQEAIVLYHHTAEHPAQTQLITVDKPVGIWEEVKMSGAFPAVEQKRLLEKVEKLIIATKKAREGANLVAAPDQDVGTKVLGWLFTSK